eukprot:1160580-Pelagomonas_calceolata.AAC.9
MSRSTGMIWMKLMNMRDESSAAPAPAACAARARSAALALGRGRVWRGVYMRAPGAIPLSCKRQCQHIAAFGAVRTLRHAHLLMHASRKEGIRELSCGGVNAELLATQALGRK